MSKYITLAAGRVFGLNMGKMGGRYTWYDGS